MSSGCMVSGAGHPAARMPARQGPRYIPRFEPWFGFEPWRPAFELRLVEFEFCRLDFPELDLPRPPDDLREDLDLLPGMYAS